MVLKKVTIVSIVLAATGIVTMIVGLSYGQPLPDTRPRATDDNISVSNAGAAVINVLNNDYAPIGSDGARLSIIGVSQPNHGSVTINADGTIIYSPPTGFSGVDTFSYTISDINGNTDSADVTVSVETSENNAPSAEAGIDLTVNEGDIVFLNGSGSTDSDGDALSYSWKVVTTDHAVRLENSNTPTPSFLVPQINTESGSIVFELTVSDSSGALDFDTVNITVRNVNKPPKAHAGDDLVSIESDTDVGNGSEIMRIALDGSQSMDSDGQIISYFWEQIEGMPKVNLDDNRAQIASFDAPNLVDDTTLTFRLTITDTDGVTDADTVAITIRHVNHAPSANAGDDLLAVEQTEVVLNGTNSVDPERDDLTFSWVQIGGEPVELFNSNSAITTFISPEITGSAILNFELIVSDGEFSSSDTVEVEVLDDQATNLLLDTDSYTDSVSNDIQDAEKFVYATTYYADAYQGNKIIRELEAAVKRGVEVRLMFDAHSFDLHPSIQRDLERLGIPFKVVSSHAKIVVIDNKIAYVGSANWNQNGLEHNWELGLKTRRASSVAEAYNYVNSLWETGSKPVTYSNDIPERFVNGPEFYELLLTNLQQADESLKMIMYEMTYDYRDSDAIDSKVVNELRKASNRGIDIEIILDDSRYNTTSQSAREFLQRYGITHKIDEPYSGREILHGKVILIDEKILFIGSQNWNKDSLVSSQEASIMTTDEEMISDFLRIFNKKWKASYSPNRD